MKLETFFEKFDQFADAPDAVAKMRELVLELAIQGKLVAQSSNDEPAFKQLERIASKKSKTGRVARVKAGRTGSSAAEETETLVPGGWEKTSLAELVTVLNGRAYSKDELLAAGTAVLRVGNLFTSKHWYYSDLQLEPDKYCDKGDLIFAWSASFGPFIWPGPKVIYHYHIWKLELHSEADLHKGYLNWFLQNKTQEIKRAGHGVSMLHMTKEKMEKLEVMLPPLAEQKRIVAKVDELMALCDRLEAQQQERETRHAALARASLARFADAPTPANLNFLFHDSYFIDPADLRKIILTLAVQGKLVPQDPNDEPGEAILQRIHPGALPKKTGDGSSEGNELETLPFDLPSGWSVSRLGSILLPTRGISYGVIKLGAEPQHGGVFILRCSNVRFRRIDLNGIRKVTEQLSSEYDRTILEGGEVLINVRGTLGGCAVVPPELKGYNIAREVAVIPVHTEIDPTFLLNVIASPYFQDRVDENLRGIAYEGLNLGLLRDFLVPIPPVAEQRHIVAKVDQLMALVDELETQLAASRATAEKLLEAVVAELTTQD